MASKILNTRIQLKYDTEANWTSKNPVLLSGELAVSSDKNGQFKTGNGTSTWSQLSYNQVPWTSVTGRPSSMKNPSALTVQFNGVTNKTYDGSSAQTVNITPGAIGAAPTTHSHNYAGSSSSGGAANSATKLVTARKIGTANFDGTADISLGEYTVSVPVSAWSSAYPFTATVSVSGIKAAKNYVMSKSNYSTKTLADVKTYEKNIGYIFWAEPADGSVKFYAKKKPTIDFTIQLKEVL